MNSSGLPSCVSMTSPFLTTSVRRAEAAQQRARRQADEGIAAKALAADHRFQQEGVLAGVLRLRQFQVQRTAAFRDRRMLRRSAECGCSLAWPAI